MRLTTFASAAVLALSTAALAQVGQTPEEQKLPANEVRIPDDTTRPEANATGNAIQPAAGAPSSALVNSIGGGQATPVGRRPPN